MHVLSCMPCHACLVKHSCARSRAFTRPHTHTRTHTHTHTHTHIYTHPHPHPPTHTHTHTHIHIHARTHTHTHTNKHTPLLAGRPLLDVDCISYREVSTGRKSLLHLASPTVFEYVTSPPYVCELCFTLLCRGLRCYTLFFLACVNSVLLGYEYVVAFGAILCSFLRL
jgi:hypothetical protein